MRIEAGVRTGRFERRIVRAPVATERRREDRSGDLAARAPSRALVALTPEAVPVRAPAPLRAFAPFIVHLHAVAQNWPQTRARRRAEPGPASAAYETGATLRAPDLSGAIAERIA